MIWNKTHKGMSLIEVLVAIAILSTGFLLILGMFPTSFSGIKHGKNVYYASALGQRKLEEMKGLGIDGIRALNTAAYDGGGTVQAGTDTMTSMVNGVTQTTPFNWQVITPGIPGILHPGATTQGTAVVVTITWFDKALGSLSEQGGYLAGSAAPRSLTLETWVLR